MIAASSIAPARALRRGAVAWLLALAVLGALAATGRPARGEALVLDACMKQCDAEDLRAIGLFRYALQSGPRRGDVIAEVPEVIERLGPSAPFSGIDDPRLTVAALTEHLKIGIASWAGGQHKEAAQRLATALAEAADNPATVVSDPTLRQLIPRAYVGWAVSLMRLNRVDEAKQAIAELVRATPGTSILDSWGTEADRIFQLARKELAARGTGTLAVEVDDPSAIFYLDEAGQPHRTELEAELLPGTYRVFVLDALGRSRRYRVDVAPHRRTALEIDWRHDTYVEATALPRRVRIETHQGLDFEATLVPRQPRIGFTFPSYAERRLEGDYARRIAARAHSERVAVIGRIRWKGRPAVIGVLYRPGRSEAARVGIVPIADEPDTERELAEFLFGPEVVSPGVIALAAPPWEVLPPEHDARSIPTTCWAGCSGPGRSRGAACWSRSAAMIRRRASPAWWSAGSGSPRSR
jgi:tetratricopeptide (TPR) repeat protein